MKFKDHRNSKIWDDVYFYLHIGKYGEFTYLLSEIFQRRAYQYGIDEWQIEQEIKNFADNVDKIEIVNGPNSLNGQFFVKEKKIEIYDESVVEKSSFDTVFNSRIRRETNGYNLITPCNKLLSIALRISEKDFLKKGIEPYSSLICK